MDSYEMVVRHKVKGESVEALAARFNLDAKSVEHRVRRFLSLLPSDNRGGRWLQRRAELLQD